MEHDGQLRFATAFFVTVLRMARAELLLLGREHERLDKCLQRKGQYICIA